VTRATKESANIGLSGLHHLPGRVGLGAFAGQRFLFADPPWRSIQASESNAEICRNGT
jgi:RecG-like helicase